MTNKEKIKYLNQYRAMNAEIDQISDELKRWQDVATRISPSYSDMPHGAQGDKLQTAATEVAELTEQLNEKIRQALAAQQEIKELIGTIDDGVLRRLMTYRYIHGRKWEEIAVLMNYDFRYVLKLHSKALCQIAEEDIERHYKSVI